MRESLRDVQGPMVLLSQFDRQVPKVAGRFGPQVHDDVEDRTAGGADQFRLSGRRALEMHPPQCPHSVVVCEVGLGDHGLQAVFCELLLAERSGEESAIILAQLEVDHERPAEFGLGEDHSFLLGVAGASRS